ncbi:MAG: hypothetical protein JO364_06725 [Pseudonocardiales bacterium]|nr:hypothetical protein [Pseudonocardiales bacterium]MBV9029995.1 hypothetical protein [Pseudonocardiales bacterium]
MAIEPIKFLCGQTAELLKRGRERSKETADEATAQVDTPPLEGQLEPLRPYPEVLEELKPRLRELRGLLHDYVDGIEEIDPANTDLLKTADALRQALEAIYGQRITFRSEQRSISGPVVKGTLDVRVVAGAAAAVRARAVTGSSSLLGEVHADEAKAGGEIRGVDIGEVGGV